MGLTAQGIVNKLPFGKYATTRCCCYCRRRCSVVVVVVEASSAKMCFELPHHICSVFHAL